MQFALQSKIAIIYTISPYLMYYHKDSKIGSKLDNGFTQVLLFILPVIITVVYILLNNMIYKWEPMQ